MVKRIPNRLQELEAKAAAGAIGFISSELNKALITNRGLRIPFITEPGIMDWSNPKWMTEAEINMMSFRFYFMPFKVRELKHISDNSYYRPTYYDKVRYHYKWTLLGQYGNILEGERWFTTNWETVFCHCEKGLFERMYGFNKP